MCADMPEVPIFTSLLPLTSIRGDFKAQMVAARPTQIIGNTAGACAGVRLAHGGSALLPLASWVSFRPHVASRWGFRSKTVEQPRSCRSSGTSSVRGLCSFQRRLSSPKRSSCWLAGMQLQTSRSSSKVYSTKGGRTNSCSRRPLTPLKN